VASERPLKDPVESYLRTTFLERIAHEVRGPAGVTAGALDEIERAMGSNAEPLRSFFVMAKRGIRRILRTADRLEHTAHFEGSAAGGNGTPVDLREVVASAVGDSEYLEARRGIRVEVAAAADPCPVRVEVRWVRAAIAEVVNNAIRFARTAVAVDTRLAEGECRVTVVDDGPGFGGPIPRRFEPPYPRAGVGLSLPFVSDVVDAHRGRLSIQDRKRDGGSAGTRVVVAFPAVDSP
jgi:signal transduction histidine kinase